MAKTAKDPSLARLLTPKQARSLANELCAAANVAEGSRPAGASGEQRSGVFPA
jgi:hypothetical protein